MVPSGHPASSNTSGLKAQLAISFTLGVGCFLAFCFLRTRWTVLFAPRTKLQRNTPPILTATFFGWIPQLLRIPEAELLDCVGLDAAMMLRFFVMSLKLFTACMIPGILVILPINNYSTNDGRLPTDPDDNNDIDPSLPNALPRQGTSLLYLFTQFTFTWIFSLFAIYSIWRTYEGYIDIRRRYLLKRRKAIVNRTIMVIGLPSHLQSDRALATFYESLDVGTVESAHVGRHVTTLKRLIEQRAYALRKLEVAYTEYYGNPSGRPDFDPEAIEAENERIMEQHIHHTSGVTADAGEHSLNSDQSQAPVPEGEDRLSLVNVRGEKTKKRPNMRLGFLGIFGRKVDAIDYKREIFMTLDRAVQKMRVSRVFATTGIGFVTFEEMNAAQILAQTVNTQETLSCESYLAPEPRDVYWDNLNLPPSELDVRAVVINVIVFFLVFFWAGPVGVFSSFLNLDSLNKILPGVSKLAGKSAILKSLIQGFLPTVGVIIFLAVVPQILMSLCRRQGIRSHSEIAQSIYNKYFTFILFNIVLVFTIVGTWAQAFNKVYHNLGELTLLLAVSLPRVAPFFVNFTILRGIGLFPLQLLQTADVFGLMLQSFMSKTPRDYAEARAPPELPYGVVYANATLVFVVILIYSCIRPLIMVFGVIYFAVGYLVFKYQLLYVYFHPYESGGRIWPMVYNRMTLGLLIFQFTMLGLFMLKHAYFFGVLLAPLPAGTAWFWYWTTNTYKWTAEYMPLELLRPAEAQHDHDAFDHPSFHGSRSSTSQDLARETNSSLAALGSEIGTFGKGLGGHVAVDIDAKKSRRINNISSGSVGGVGIVVTTPGGSRRRIPKSVVDEDDYQAMPDRYTDYRQPPMTLYPGVLNSGMRHYCHPALAGPLPTLWLPLKKGETQDKNKSRSFDGEEANVGDSVHGNGDGYRSHRASLSLPNRDSDQVPRSYDEGDNMAGGGQDEDDDGEEDLMDMTNDGGLDNYETSGGTVVQDQAGQGQVGSSFPSADAHGEGSQNIDESSDVMGGSSFPGSLADDPQAHPSRPPPNSSGSASSAALKRNPAVEGISDVYYHHPERRASNASSTSALRNMAVSSAGMQPPRSMPAGGHRGSRASLLRDHAVLASLQEQHQQQQQPASPGRGAAKGPPSAGSANAGRP